MELEMSENAMVEWVTILRTKNAIRGISLNQILYSLHG